MRRIINSTNASLDGVVEIMGSSRWHFGYIDDEFDTLSWNLLSGCDAVLMGRRTYESFAAAWPSRSGDYADRINAMTKYVASTTLEDADWNNSTIIGGDIVDEMTKIKEQPGQDILMFGFGPVARTLLRHGLLDEIRLWIHPVLAGEGGPSDLLFREGDSSRLNLVENRSLASGVVVLSYRPDPGSAEEAP